MQKSKLFALAAFVVMAPITAVVGSNSKHSSMIKPKAELLSQTGGQAAFAEIALITSELREDPTTDWSKVDIDGLRAHLIDMNNLILHANVSTKPTERGAIFNVTGKTADIVQSIQNMTQAHGKMMVAEGMTWKSETRPDGMTVTVRAADGTGTAMVQALGLFGLMTLGDHHAVHHRLMARGQRHH